MFYKVIYFAFLGTSLSTFMNVDWCWSKERCRLFNKARCRLFNFHEPCFKKLFVLPI